VVLSAAVLLLAGAGTARSADVRVDAAQNVTVHGSSQSLKDVVVELCGAA